MKFDIKKLAGNSIILQRWLYRLFASRFFLVAVILELGIFAIFGGMVLWEKIIQPPIEDFEGTDFIVAPPGPPPAPPAASDVSEVSVDIPEVTQPTPAPTMSDLIVADTTAAPSFMPEISVATVNPNIDKMLNNIQNIPKPTAAKTTAKPLSKERLQGIAGRIGSGAPDGVGFGIGNTAGGGVTGVQAKFTAYVAKYSGGDWAQNVRLDGSGQRIIFGSIPNLMTQISRWNKKLQANIEGKPLSLSSEEIFSVKPPAVFIYMTGNRDFILTETEIGILQKFFVQGGVVWGDAGMPGRNSRFDIAFRREMRRVLPDPDQEFQPIDATHPIFTQQGTLVRDIPMGMNFYREPAEIISISDKVAVFYTLNSYGNMWQISLDDRDKVIERAIKRKNGEFEIYTNETIWNRRMTYYRNVTQESVTEAYKLGINATVFFLLQYQKELATLPALKP
ncbi:MAG: DUF4159 domain-containing protein [Verrucomicrobiae bacterium]|nr:DUF4159 domain-containing protein [Verrucomicrobiae bacterium]